MLGGRRLRGRGRAPGLRAPRRRPAVSPRLQHPEQAARGVCCAEPPLCISGASSGSAVAGRGGPPLRPSSAPPPDGPAPAELGRAAGRPGCQKFAGKGRGRGGVGGTRAPRSRAVVGRAAAGKPGQDVTSSRRGKFNWEGKLHPGWPGGVAPGPWPLGSGPPCPQRVNAEQGGAQTEDGKAGHLPEVSLEATLG